MGAAACLALAGGLWLASMSGEVLAQANTAGDENESIGEAALSVPRCPMGTPVPPPNSEGHIESPCWPQGEVITRGEIHMTIR